MDLLCRLSLTVAEAWFDLLKMKPKLSWEHVKSFQSTTPLTLTNYIRVYIDASFVLGMCPFRLKLQRDFGKYTVIQGSWIFKVFCVCYTILGAFWVILDIRLAFPNYRKNPSLYFHIIYKLMSCIAKGICIWKFWFGKQEFCDILNFILDKRNSLNIGYHSAKVGKKGTILILIIFISMGLSDFITGRAVTPWSYRPAGWRWSLNWWWTTMIKAGRCHIRLDSTSMFLNSSYVPDISLMDKTLGVLSAIGLFHRRIFGAFSDLFLLFAAITMWSVVQLFTMPLRTNTCVSDGLSDTKHVIIQIEKKIGWQVVFEKYRNLRRFADLINRTYGNLTGVFVAVAVLDYSTTVGNLVDGKFENWSLMMGMTFYVSNSYATLLICASVCHLV